MRIRDWSSDWCSSDLCTAVATIAPVIAPVSTPVVTAAIVTIPAIIAVAAILAITAIIMATIMIAAIIMVVTARHGWRGGHKGRADHYECGARSKQNILPGVLHPYILKSRPPCGAQRTEDSR